MKLQQALLTIINQSGTDILKTPYLLNILSDLGAFSEFPSARNVFEGCIKAGYLNIAKDNVGSDNFQAKFNGIVEDLYNKMGYRKDMASFVMSEICSAFGITVNQFVPIDNKVDSEDKSNSFLGNNSFPKQKKGPHMEFKGIEIDGTCKKMSSQLQNLGFSEITTFDNGSIVMNGTFAGVYGCDVLLCSSQFTNKIWKILVRLPAEKNWYSLKDRYLKLKGIFTKKYGHPDAYEYFTSPYEEGDGYEITAFGAGNATYASYFKTDKGYIVVQIIEDGVVELAYEDDINADMHSKAQDQAAENDI